MKRLHAVGLPLYDTLKRQNYGDKRKIIGFHVFGAEGRDEEVKHGRFLGQ